MKKIAVLTSGGDSPGMNACIANLFTLCQRNDMELYGIKEGYKGLMDEDIVLLMEADVQNIYNLGGSVIKTARSEEFLTKAGQEKAVAVLKKHKFDALIVIGGNGSYMGAQDLAKQGIKIIALPGTIDNDLNYTEKSLGFDTAVNNGVSAIDKIKDTMNANDRGVVIEVMGRRSGDIALYSATASNADMVVVQEIKTSESQIIARVKTAIKRGVASPCVIVAENILEVSTLAKTLEQATGKTFKSAVLGYLQRGGNPTVFDRNFAMELAVRTIDLIKIGKYNRAVGLEKGQIYDTPLEKVLLIDTNFNFQLYELFETLNR